MPNRNYEKGRRKEYKIINHHKERGWIAFRTAGSRSPIDVVAIHPGTKIIRFIQAKPDTMSDNEKNKLKEANKGLNGSFYCRFEVI